MEELPSSPAGTVAILSTGAGEPHAIPISTAVRKGPRRMDFALAHGRESLARLRSDSRCALTILAAGDLAITLIGRAREVSSHERVVVLALDVERIQDHGRDTFVVDDGVQWHWVDDNAAGHDAAIRELVASAA